MLGDIFDPQGRHLGQLDVPDGASPADIDRMVAEAQRVATAPTPTIPDLVRQEAVAQGVPPDLAMSVARAESANSQNARSPKGAMGVMQLMPETARDLGIDPTDLHQNIQGGVQYLKRMLDRYQGNQALALAAYNAGPGNVDKAGGIPNFPETQQYVRRVLGMPPPPSMPVAPWADGLDTVPARFGIPSPSQVIQQTHQQMGRIPGPLIAGAMLPTGAALPAEMLMQGAWGAITEADRIIGAKMQSSGETGLSGAYHAIDSLDMNDAVSIAKWAIVGAGTGLVARGMSRAIFGPANPERQAATEALTNPTTGEVPPLTTTKKGFALRDYLRRTRPDLIPQPDTATTDAAYSALRQARGDLPVDTGPLRDTLTAVRENFQKAGLPVPAALSPDTLAPAEPLDIVLDRLSSINTLKRARAQGIEAGLPAAKLEDVSKRVYDAVSSVLTPEQQGLLQDAVAARLDQGQLQRLNTLVTKPGASMLKTLQEDAPRWRVKLGDYYDTALAYARNVATLQEKPEGRAVVGAMIAAAEGAAIGAGTAAVTGQNPLHGAATGAGSFAAYRLFKGATGPRVVALTEAMTRARPTSDTFFSNAGRLILTARAAASSPERATVPGDGAVAPPVGAPGLPPGP